MMAKSIRYGLLAVMMVLIAATWGFAGNGHGPGNCDGPVHDIYSGVPFNYQGTVVAICSGQGMILATEEGNVIIYGIGPMSYWESLGVERPAVGEEVEVSGYAVDYNGIVRNIAVSMVVDGQEITLRDPDTGQPLWRRGRHSNRVKSRT